MSKEEAIVKRIGSQWCVVSESGKKLGCYKSRREAVKRLKQIEMFKHMKSDSEEARQHCYCRTCGAEFFTNKACYESRCPVCGEQDDLTELTGIY